MAGPLAQAEGGARAPAPDSAEDRILLAAPLGHDAAVAGQVLAEAGLKALPCRDLAELLQAWEGGAGALVVAEEALVSPHLPALLEALARQPPWSDIPVIVLTGGTDIGQARLRTLDIFAPAGNVTFLERPFRRRTLLSILQVALHARRRQYQLRTTLADLRDSEERLRLALEVGEVAAWEWDLASGAVTGWGRAHALPGLVAGGLKLRGAWENLLAWVHAEDRERVSRAVRQALKRGGELSLEFRARLPGGATRWLLTRARVDRAGGLAGRVAGATLDISQRKRAEEELRQAQKMEAIGKLAGGIAHDFNNILTAINGYSQLLLDQAGGEDPARSGLEEIHRAGMRAAALTHQLLAYTRQQVMAFRSFDLNDAVRGLEGMLRRLIREDIALSLSLAPALPPVRADFSQVEQVILNLAVNARDALPAGGRITIETAVEAAGEISGAAPASAAGGPARAAVRLSVRDDGVGMDEAVKARIFEPFFTTKGQGKGTGLGLSTVYGIVEQLGGRLQVESAPGRGSTFTVLFPACADPPHPAPGAAGAPAKALAPGKGATILVAEDEEAVRGFLTVTLRACGYTVLAAGRGEEALALASGHPGGIRLLLTDVVMPGMGGRELSERMRALRPDLRVLFVSGHHDDAILRHGVLDGQVAFLGKPFSLPDLLGKIGELLQAEPARP